jgi:predicted MFS family arabinose efflux permease
MAIAANSVPEKDLASAVSLQSAANNLTRVAGPLLAAPLVATSRFEVSFGLYMIAAATAAGLTAAMRIERYEPEQEEGGILARMASGFVHARERRPALPALLTVGVLSFFGVSHTVLVPAYAAEVLGNKAWFAWLAAATGLGAMAGALRTGRAGRTPRMRSATLGMVAYGIALGSFAWTDRVWMALLAQLVVGYFYFAIMTSLQTLVQQIVDETKRGRVMSLFQVCWAGLVPFGSLALGFLAGPLGTPDTLMLSALVCGAYGVLMTLLAPRLPVWGRADPLAGR